MSTVLAFKGVTKYFLRGTPNAVRALDGVDSFNGFYADADLPRVTAVLRDELELYVRRSREGANP